MSISSSSRRLTIVPDVLFRIVGNESVLLNLKTEQYLGLNAVGTRMWTALQDETSIDTAYDALLNEFEVQPAQLRHDLDEFIGKLAAKGLVEIRPE